MKATREAETIEDSGQCKPIKKDVNPIQQQLSNVTHYLIVPNQPKLQFLDFCTSITRQTN